MECRTPRCGLVRRARWYYYRNTVSKITSKYQVSVPRDLARAYGIKPGDDLEWQAAGESLRVSRARRTRRPGAGLPVAARLRLFDAATDRQHARNRPDAPVAKDRGWTREDLYADRLK